MLRCRRKQIGGFLKVITWDTSPSQQQSLPSSLYFKRGAPTNGRGTYQVITYNQLEPIQNCGLGLKLGYSTFTKSWQHHVKNHFHWCPIRFKNPFQLNWTGIDCQCWKETYSNVIMTRPRHANFTC